MSSPPTPSTPATRPTRDGTYWSDGLIVDARGRRPFAWAWVFAVAVMVLGADVFLGIARPAAAERSLSSEAESFARRIDRLADAANDGVRSVLLVGDSVLAGNVLAPHRPDWADVRILDQLRREVSPDAAVAIDQVAFDGQLPVDMLAVSEILDRADPEGAVELVVALNLRYFSDAYRETYVPTRASLEHVGTGGGAFATVAAAAAAARTTALASAPVWRHRDWADAGTTLGDDLANALMTKTPTESDDDAEATRRAAGMARVRQHYRSARLDSDHAQTQALGELLRRARARGRTVHVVMVPLEDRFAASSFKRGRLSRLAGYAADLVHRSGTASIFSLDHPRFGPEHFVDHVHLTAEGNRLFAIGLLAELGIPLARRPALFEVNEDSDPDRTLVGNVDPGYADGPAWQARFDHPRGLAVHPDETEVVVADTGNHVLRRLRGSMSMVETWVGKPNQAGDADGRATKARLRSPRSITIDSDGTTWFVDGAKAERIRRVRDGRVETMDRPPGQGALSGLRWAHGSLWVVEGRRSLWRRAEGGRWIRAIMVGAEDRIVSFCVAGPRRVFFADPEGRVRRADLAKNGTLKREQIVFANAGRAFVPKDRGALYPFPFRQLNLGVVRELEWLPHYGSLLVQTQLPDRRKKGDSSPPGDRIHMFVLDLDEKQVYPWIRSRPFADSSLMWNGRTRQYVSSWRRGTFALTADGGLYYLERERPRLIRTSDGMLDLTKTSTLRAPGLAISGRPSRLGGRAPIRAMARFGALDEIGSRTERVPLDGPFVTFAVGSSFTAVSDRLGNYSFIRKLEVELRRELGFRNGVRHDIVHRVVGAARLDDVANVIEAHDARGGRPDVIMIGIHDTNGTFLADTGPGGALAQLQRIARVAERHGALAVAIDTHTLRAKGRDGLRPRPKSVIRTLRLARRLGFVVVEPAPVMVARELTLAPWGHPPWSGGKHHAGPAAIDEVAAEAAARLRPILAEHFAGRIPGWARDELGPATQLDALQGYLPEDDWGAGAPEVRPGFVETALRAGEVVIFVDVKGAPPGAAPDAIARGVLFQTLVAEGYALMADRVSITLARYRSYDEYGEGVRDAAEIVWTRQLDGEDLARFVDESP